MSRVVTTKKEVTCTWCQKPILIGEPAVVSWETGYPLKIHPQCEDPIFRNQRGKDAPTAAEEN